MRPLCEICCVTVALTPVGLAATYEQGRGWGFDQLGIWVDNGCRAVFEIGGAS